MRLHDGAVYLDSNATVPMCAEALAAFLEAEKTSFANPSAPYPAGEAARATLEKARNAILAALRYEGDLIFTGSGTEANHLAILSASASRAEKRVLISKIEHPSCYELKGRLRSSGVAVEEFGADKNGTADLDHLRGLLKEPASLVVLMSAHNETGVVQPVREAIKVCREKGVLFHTDAVQAFGKVSLPSDGEIPDTAAIAAHKIGGPKGIGALFCRKGTKIVPMFSGGGQERGLRASTEAVSLAAAFAAAAGAIDLEGYGKLARSRDFMEDKIAELCSPVRFYGKSAARLPNTSFFSMTDIDGRTVQSELAKVGFYVGTGSACHGAGSEIPRVLRETGWRDVSFPLRVSLSRETSPEDAGNFLEALAKAVKMV